MRHLEETQSETYTVASGEGSRGRKFVKKKKKIKIKSGFHKRLDL